MAKAHQEQSRDCSAQPADTVAAEAAQSEFNFQRWKGYQAINRPCISLSTSLIELAGCNLGCLCLSLLLEGRPLPLHWLQQNTGMYAPGHSCFRHKLLRSLHILKEGGLVSNDGLWWAAWSRLDRADYLCGPRCGRLFNVYKKDLVKFGRDNAAVAAAVILDWMRRRYYAPSRWEQPVDVAGATRETGLTAKRQEEAASVLLKHGAIEKYNGTFIIYFDTMRDQRLNRMQSLNDYFDRLCTRIERL